MPNGVADLSLQSSIPHVWFVLYRYIVKSPATILNERFDFLICLFVVFFLNVRNSNKGEVPKKNPRKHNGIMHFNNSRFVTLYQYYIICEIC